METWLTDRVSSLPDGLPWCLVHGDYRLDDVIIDSSFSSLRAVLHWEMATLGDPVADLVIALAYGSQVDDVLHRKLPVARDATSGTGFWRREDIVTQYQKLTELDLAHLEDCGLCWLV